MVISKRARFTDVPCIVQMQEFLAEGEGDAPCEKLYDGPMMSLAQGAVYWNPPAACVAEAAQRLADGGALLDQQPRDVDVAELARR